MPRIFAGSSLSGGPGLRQSHGAKGRPVASACKSQENIDYFVNSTEEWMKQNRRMEERT